MFFPAVRDIIVPYISPRRFFHAGPPPHGGGGRSACVAARGNGGKHIMEKRRKRKRGRFLSFVLAFFLAAVPIPASAVTGAVPRSLAGRSGDFLIRARPVGEDPAEGGALSVEILPQADGVPEGASFFFSVGLLDAPDALYELTAAGGFAPGAGVKIWRLAGGE